MQKHLILLFIILQSANLSAQNLELVNTLEPSLLETSGLIYIHGKLITHTDSGGENALYEIDTATGSVSRTVYITNAINRDWEDICSDDAFIYLADFGNNNGNRTNLGVYKISISDYFNAANDSVQADTILFSYQDQTDFAFGTNNTNFDAEAIISYDTLLYIFTKNWIDSKCNVYALSKNPGTYTITKVDSFDSEGLITGACYNENSNAILLTGYGPPIPFVIRIENITSLPFSVNYRIHNFVQVPNGTSVQIEAICPIDEETYYLSSEQSQLGDAMLSILNVNALLSIQDGNLEHREVFPNPSIEFIEVQLSPNEYLVVYTINGQVVLKTQNELIATKHLAKGVYHGIIYTDGIIPVAKTKFIVH